MSRAGTSVIATLASAFHAVLTALLIFLFPEWYEPNSRYRPELHYMRGPGPKWRARHLADRGSAGGS
jgi:hypothetical protein